MTAVSIVGLIALIIFTLFLILVTLVVVRFRTKEHRDKDKPEGELEQYRRVPLIPLEAGSQVCCDSTSTRYQGLTMNTFGKGGELVGGGYTRSGDFLIIGINPTVPSVLIKPCTNNFKVCFVLKFIREAKILTSIVNSRYVLYNNCFCFVFEQLDSILSWCNFTLKYYL